MCYPSAHVRIQAVVNSQTCLEVSIGACVVAVTTNAFRCNTRRRITLGIRVRITMSITMSITVSITVSITMQRY